jgi:hypothetical protein
MGGSGPFGFDVKSGVLEPLGELLRYLEAGVEGPAHHEKWNTVGVWMWSQASHLGDPFGEHALQPFRSGGGVVRVCQIDRRMLNRADSFDEQFSVGSGPCSR